MSDISAISWQKQVIRWDDNDDNDDDGDDDDDDVVD
jgi:hypothetical protein